jgi:stage IV sporulation protein B
MLINKNKKGNKPMAKRKIQGLCLFLVSFLLIATSVFSAFGSSALGTVVCMSGGSFGGEELGGMSGLLRLGAKNTRSLDGKKLYVGGMPFGIKFVTDGVMIVGFSEPENSSGAAGLRVNDMIKSVDGVEVHSVSELTKIVENSSGRALALVYERDGRECHTVLEPIFSEAEGKYKTGLYVRDSGAGIGTVTYIDPDDLSFGGLGHGICDAQSGRLVDIYRGSVTHVTISGVVKGQVGTPGEVKGYFSSGKLGSLIENSDCGVFGILAELPADIDAEPIPIGSRSELRSGKAHIYCTLDTNKKEKYEVEISDIDLSAKGNKCFTVKVTDRALLDKTGGIVQGMSGSPIIQDGKLVGAVTHVLINDPTTGYGIFIENMPSAARPPQERAA